MRRPKVVLAMYEGFDPVPFDEEQRARIEAVADVLDWRPLADYECDRADQLLASAELIVGHWGAPLLDAAALDRAPQLQAFVYAAGTVKMSVTSAVFERGVLVTSAAAANAVPVAEYALGAILLANKNAFVLRELSRAPMPIEDMPKLHLPGNARKKIGVVGASHVGRKLIELLAPFDMEILLYDPFVDVADADRLGVELVGLDELCARCDVVSLHAPALESTMGMIGADQLAAMPDGAVIVNTARGFLVDHEALEAELISGRMSAVLDVSDPFEPPPPDSPLLNLPNVFYTPHLAGAQGTEISRLADLAVAEIERFAKGEPPLYPVGSADLDRIA